ncbi:MAG: methyltransferase domain-containing protein [Clostridiales bacterium]|nr:methyltransferase domain-containing protein [Clostridiales bacterium]
MTFNKQSSAKITKPLVDILIFLFSYFAAFFIMFEGIPDSAHLKRALLLALFVILARIACFHAFSIYLAAWKFFSVIDAVAVFRAVLPVTAALLLGRFLLPAKWPLFKLPLSIISLEFFLTLTGTLGVRMIDRLAYERAEGRIQKRKNILLIGAGEAGNNVAKELSRRHCSEARVLGFVDDDPKVFNSVIRGIRVLGNTAQIPEIIKKFNIDEAIITTPGLASEDVQRIIKICTGTKIKLKTIHRSFALVFDDTGIPDVPQTDSEAMVREQLRAFKDLTERDYDAAAETKYPVDHLYEATKPFSDPQGLSGDLLMAAGTMIKLLRLAAGASVLDLGCGCGWTSILLARCGFRVTGLDLNSSSLEIARRNAQAIGIPVTFINADMQSFTTDRFFDALVVFDSMHHCLRERSVLLRAEAALRPGGKIILCEQAHSDETRAGILTHKAAIQAMQKHGTLEKGLGTRYLVRLLFDCGFERVTVFSTPYHYRTWLMARKPRAGKEAVRSVHYTSDFERALWFYESDGLSG